MLGLEDVGKSKICVGEIELGGVVVVVGVGSLYVVWEKGSVGNYSMEDEMLRGRFYFVMMMGNRKNGVKLKGEGRGIGMVECVRGIMFVENGVGVF